MTPAATALTELTKEVLALVFQTEREALVGRAWNILRRFDEAEEAVQETALRLLGSLDSVRDPDRILGWLFQTLEHVCRDRLKRRRLEEEMSSAAKPPRSRSSSPGRVERLADAVAEVGEPYVVEDTRACVRQVLEALPADLRAVVEHGTMEGERVSTVSRVLGLPRTTVRHKLERAHQVLHARLGRLMRGLQE
ncbi:MAG TPA: sigma-70 family RNA polymerase sigma factor [Planctomycetota bacterium]|nr:sigma-70 family RNA polymerase sigma factor [Planctomycetota bacterium]